MPKFVYLVKDYGLCYTKAEALKVAKPTKAKVYRMDIHLYRSASIWDARTFIIQADCIFDPKPDTLKSAQADATVTTAH
jgi:hypothetical protein